MSLALAAFLGGVAIAAPNGLPLESSIEARGSVEGPVVGGLGAGQQIGASAQAGRTAAPDVPSDVRPLQHGWPSASGGGGNRSTEHATSRDDNDRPDNDGQGANTEPDAHGAGRGDANQAPNEPLSNPNVAAPNVASPNDDRAGDQQGPARPTDVDAGAGSDPSQRV
jgi:hypothetical protein